MKRPAVVVMVPVLDRPHLVGPLVKNVAAVTPGPYRLLFIADRDDRDELDALQAAKADFITPGGTYPEKINRAYRETDEPFLFLAADDVAFHPGWLEAATLAMTPDVNVVGTDDGGVNPRVARGVHSCHSLVRRSYCDSPGATADQVGVVLHEGYRHCYVDDELVGVAQKRGCYAHAGDALVEHRHPYSGKVDIDETYRRGRVHILRDKRTFSGRRRLWR